MRPKGDQSEGERAFVDAPVQNEIDRLDFVELRSNWMSGADPSIGQYG